jgi:phosphate transport system substrate-binding protein
MQQPASAIDATWPSASSLVVGAVVMAITFGVGATASRADLLRTGGAGAATKVMLLLGAAFSAQNPDITFKVVSGLGSSGAIAAVIDGKLDFAVAGRALKPEEAAKPLTATVLMRTAFGLASSHRNPGDIASRDIADFFLNPASTWADGTPVLLILRPRSEADSQNLADAFPRMGDALEQLRRRVEIPMAVTDQDNLRTAENMDGSLTAVTLTQMQTETPRLYFLTIDGIAPTLQNFESGAYPYSKQFNFVFPVHRTPAVERFIAFLRSPEGEKIMRANGNLAVQP